MGSRVPSSRTRPGPTARTVPSCGRSLAVSGRTMPLLVISSRGVGLTTRRSPRGLSPVAVPLTVVVMCAWCLLACETDAEIEAFETVHARGTPGAADAGRTGTQPARVLMGKVALSGDECQPDSVSRGERYEKRPGRWDRGVRGQSAVRLAQA